MTGSGRHSGRAARRVAVALAAVAFATGGAGARPDAPPPVAELVALWLDSRQDPGSADPPPDPGASFAVPEDVVPADLLGPDAGWLLFEERFEAPGPDPQRWALASGVRRVTGGGGVVLEAAAGAPAELRSRPVPVPPGAALRLELSVAGGAGAGPLHVEWREPGGAWQPLASLPAPAGSSPAPQQVSLALPPVPGGSIEVRLRVGDSGPVPGSGAWQVQHVVLRQHGVRVAVDAQGGDRVLAEPDPAGEVWPLRVLPVPLVLEWPAGQPLRLVAPRIAADGSAFRYWSVDGRPLLPPREELTLEPQADTRVVAHYLPAGAPPRVLLEVEALPAACRPVRIEVYVRAEPLVLTGRPQTVQVPAGLEVPVRAAAVPEGWVLEGWWLDGRALGGDVQIRLAGGQGAQLVARFALPGDLNGDDRVDRDDIDAFVLALIDPAAYARRYPGLDARRRGDLNADGLLDELDIEPFVDLLVPR